MEPISITITGINLADLTNKVVVLAREMYAQQQLAQPEQQPVQQTVTQQTSQQAPAQAVTPTAPATPVQPMAPTAPTTAPQYTLEQLQTAVAPLIDAGKQPELLQLLSSFGVQAFTQLPKERYGDFATAIRQLGAKI